MTGAELTIPKGLKEELEKQAKNLNQLPGVVEDSMLKHSKEKTLAVGIPGTPANRAAKELGFEVTSKENATPLKSQG